LRRNTGVGVLIDQILTAHMNVPETEPIYASGKEAHEFIYYTYKTGPFQSRVRV
jgi:hypothetical protein